MRFPESGNVASSPASVRFKKRIHRLSGSPDRILDGTLFAILLGLGAGIGVDIDIDRQFSVDKMHRDVEILDGGSVVVLEHRLFGGRGCHFYHFVVGRHPHSSGAARTSPAKCTAELLLQFALEFLELTLDALLLLLEGFDADFQLVDSLVQVRFGRFEVGLHEQ